MTGKRVSLLWLALVGAALIVFGLGWIFPTARHLRAQQETIERLEKEKAALNQKLQDLSAQLKQLSAAQGQEEPADPALSQLSKLSAEERAKRLEQVKLLGETQDRLNATSATVKQLELRLQELEQTTARLEEEKKTLASSEADLKSRLADSNRVIEAMQPELKTSSERVAKLEARNKALAAQQRDFENKTSETAKSLADLENIHRQQDTLLSGILQRYRDANDRLRSVALGGVEPQRDTPSNSLDIAQIQNVVGLVEEDLRQFRSLNAQAARIQRQLGK